LFKNGTAFARAEPPESLDVTSSQRLEPQMWGEWRQNDKGYEVRWRDADSGKALGAWRTIKGELRSPFAPGTTLNATYQNRNYEGSAGSVAANNGFSSSTTTTSSGKGTSSVSSTSGTDPASDPVTSAPSVVVTDSGSRDDGADHRGSYKLYGYTIEFTYDSGRKDRTLTFPWGSAKDKIVLWGRTYSPP
jgi:hypothetical protein